MALFEPATNVYLCKNVPLNNTYQDTIQFNSQTEQAQYFYDHAYIRFDNFSYQRELSAIRVPRNCEVLNGVCYAAYQNANFGNKWFYAFVTRIEYVSPNTSLVYLEQDYFQTWWWDFDLDECFVERETPATDTPGDNLLPEPVSGLVYKRTGIMSDLSSDMDGIDPNAFCYVLATTLNPDGTSVKGYVTQSVFTGAIYKVYNIYQIEALANDLQNWPAGKENAVLAIYTFPLPYAITNDDNNLVNCATKNYTYDIPTTNGSYTPRNKKLLTYPYTYLCVDNNQGQTKEYRYELFTSANAQFECTGSIAPGVTFYLYPTNYDGVTRAYWEMLTLSNFPMGSWNYDTYRQWFAQNSNSMAASLISNGLNIASGLLAGNVSASAGGLGGLASNMVTMWGKDADMQVLPPTFKGSLNVTNGNYSIRHQCYSAYNVYLEPNIAERIDSFFDRYGYSVMTNKLPNYTSRTKWNYVKTNGCILHGNCPLDAITAIKAAWDRGITIWHTTDVGNYSVSNTFA